MIDDEGIREIVKRASEERMLDPAIIYGIIHTESAGNQYAIRYEPSFTWILWEFDEFKPPTCSDITETTLQRMSIGLMQVMGAVYREHGYKGWLSAIFGEPYLQVKYGCIHFSERLLKYSLEKAISAYNAGAPTEANPAYVQSVLENSKKWLR